MKNKGIKALGLFVFGILLGFVLGKFYFTSSDQEAVIGAKTHEVQQIADVPVYAIETLTYIKVNNRAPEGYVGGRRFKNLEGLLPVSTTQRGRINYREWDVHPKTEGKSRGAERLVTGDDKSAYFTVDHYQSFVKVE